MSESGAVDLSGVWSGNYIYPGSLDPVSFVAEIRHLGDSFSGVVSEPAPAETGLGEIDSVITGTCAGSRVAFTKIYDEPDIFLQPVDYDGTVDSDGTEIVGEWTITGEYSGGFVMARAKLNRQEETIDDFIEVIR